MPSPTARRLPSHDLTVLVLLACGLSDEEIAETARMRPDQVVRTLDRVARFLEKRLATDFNRSLARIDLDAETQLSRREYQVARLGAQGLTDPEIASQLGVGLRTAETHMSEALKKLNLRSRRKLSLGRPPEQPDETSRHG